MSAYCNLAGLYPPEGTQVWSTDIKWQPIPVHTRPYDTDPVGSNYQRFINSAIHQAAARTVLRFGTKNKQENLFGE